MDEMRQREATPGLGHFREGCFLAKAPLAHLEERDIVAVNGYLQRCWSLQLYGEV